VRPCLLAVTWYRYLYLESWSSPNHLVSRTPEPIPYVNLYNLALNSLLIRTFSLSILKGTTIFRIEWISMFCTTT
jgi:hypothetical protein